ncbi:MAG: STAS domain-containing protein [Ketobacteraceae bacterium]|nr:STAS domain-containing protein [Ketobacteraceae bacterium]
MTIQISKTGGPQTLKVGEQLIIQDMQEVHRKFAESVTGELPLTLDLSACQHLDGSGVQWLLFIREFCRGKAVDVALVNISDELRESLELLGWNDLETA